MPLLVVSLLYLALVLVELLPGMGLGPGLLALDGLFWLAFVIDYAWRVFFLAPKPWAYARQPLCLLDLLVVASFPTLLALSTGILGLARASRVVAQFLRLARSGAQAARTAGQANRVFSRRSLRWVAPLAAVIILFAVLFAWRFEAAHHNARLDGLGESLWWAIATLTTVGYGDAVPQSPEGRIAAAILMLVGVVVFGGLTAALASLFVESDEATSEAEIHGQLEEIAERLRLIEAHLSASFPRDGACSKDDVPAPASGLGTGEQ